MDTEKKLSPEKVKELWAKGKDAVGKVSKKVWIICAVVIVAIAAGITIYLNTRPYSILVTGASASEVSTVTTWLENRGVQNYRLQGNNTVLVPDRQAAALKAALLTEMYSEGSYDYSVYFDNVGMLSTESERNNAWKIAVEQKMEAVISQMKGVLWASVNITPGEDRIYVLDSGNVVEASAGILVETRDGKVLDSNVANAIRRYVSSGIQGLSIDSITLDDTNGNHYGSSGVSSGSGSLSEMLNASALKFQLEQEQANILRTEIMGILAPLFGPDNIRVAVKPTVDVDYTIIDENEVDIPDYIDEEHRGAGEGIKSSQIYNHIFNLDDLNLALGLVGAEPNSDVINYVEPGTDQGNPDRELNVSGQIDYVHDNRTTHKVRVAGYVTDCHVSISVNSTSPAAQVMNVELLREAVANAAGISAIATENMTAAEYLAGKVTIYSGPFYQPGGSIIDGGWWPFGDIIPEWMVLAALAGLLLFVIVLTVILMVHGRNKKKRLAALEAEEAERAALEASELERREAEAALAQAMGMPQTELVGADVMSLQTEKSMELRQDIRQFVEENPEVAAQLLKSWLRGGEDRG